jgi:hypothetical protein
MRCIKKTLTIKFLHKYWLKLQYFENDRYYVAQDNNWFCFKWDYMQAIISLINNRWLLKEKELTKFTLP